MAARVYLTGAAGSGTSTLGRAIAVHLGVTHLDTDDYYWRESAIPFTDKRPAAERIEMILEAQAKAGGDWVLSGSADGWGEPILKGLDLIVFVTAPTPLRLARLRKREGARFGDRIRPGGDMAHNHAAFLKWAAGYDDPYFSGRSLQRHRDWLAGRKEPILELSGGEAVEAQLQAVLDALGRSELL